MQICLSKSGKYNMTHNELASLPVHFNLTLHRERERAIITVVAVVFYYFILHSTTEWLMQYTLMWESWEQVFQLLGPPSP